MLGKEDGDGDGGGAGCGSRLPPLVSGDRRTYWRSASWSSSRGSLPPLNPESGKDCVDPNGSSKTPRTNSKGRSLLPPLSIARRSLDEWPKAGSDDIGEWHVPSTPGGRDSSNGGERLKLDLSSIQGTPDNNSGLLKREKIAFFDKKCSKVADHLFLGGDAVARDKNILNRHGITHILNCVGFVCPECFPENFVYRTLWLQDNPSEDITSILYDVFDYFEDVREQNGKVFVHCCQGVSRSTSLVIAYRMWREGQSFDDAFRYVKAARGIADPNMGFACQLLQCQKRVHAFPLSPSSLLRLYRIAPHSSYDPLHLVPKMLNSPSPAALDSRGAFIVHVPSAVYVWVGRKCDPIMERDARGAVCQIVRYEKVKAPIVVVNEGEEPPEFWDAFSSFLPSVVNGADVPPGGRAVEAYDVDFGIFRKATAGGFVPPFVSSETDHETRLPARESSWSGLRRKFAVGNMKEFVSASKSAPIPSRVYPDSAPIVGVENRSVSKPRLFPSSSPSPSFSSASSSSPDSVSSDSCYTDSPAASPIAGRPLPSTLAAFSNLSIASTKLSPQSISTTSEFIDVNFMSKRLLLSIAERRGGTPKCLKLPIPNDNDSCEKGNVPVNNDIVLELTRKGPNQDSAILGSSCSKGVFNQDSCGPQENPPLEPRNVSEGVKQPVVARVWPGLEKVPRVGAGELDSRRVFVYTAPDSGSGDTGDRFLYIWVGKDFGPDCRSRLEASKGPVGPVDFDVKEVIDDVLARTGLSDDTRVKVVMQDEEPSEFLELLNPL